MAYASEYTPRVPFPMLCIPSTGYRKQQFMTTIAKHPRPAPSVKEKSRVSKQRLNTTLRAYLWLAPLIICLAIIVVYPLVNGFILSFTNADQTNIAVQIGSMSYPATYKFIGLQNYVGIITSWFTPGSDESH